MKKYLIKLWCSYPSFERAHNEGGKYVTLRITETTEEDRETNFNVFNDGVCYIACDEYEIIGSQSSSKWSEIVEFEFDGVILTIIPKGENYRISFPTEIDD